MPDRSQSQQSNVLPARRGEIYPLGVTVTPTAWDISQLPLKLVTAPAVYAQSIPSGVRSQDWMEVAMQANGGDVYYQWAPDNTNVGSTSPTLTLGTGGGALTAASSTPNTMNRIPSGMTRTERINRSQDRVLILATSAGTATLIVLPVSQS